DRPPDHGRAREGDADAAARPRDWTPSRPARSRDLRPGDSDRPGGEGRTAKGERMTEPGGRGRSLTKIFRGDRREAGLGGGLKSLVRRISTEVAAASDVTFEIEPGEMVGYIGANGAGKSTTIKMLTGILTPSSGEILCNGFVPARGRTR